MTAFMRDTRVDGPPVKTIILLNGQGIQFTAKNYGRAISITIHCRQAMASEVRNQVSGRAMLKEEFLDDLCGGSFLSGKLRVAMKVVAKVN